MPPTEEIMALKKMPREVLIAIQTYLLGLGVISVALFGCGGLHIPGIEWSWENSSIYCIVFYIVINVVVFIIHKGDDWQIGVRACFIGTCSGVGAIITMVYPDSYKPFGLYLAILSTFHITEYIVTGLTNPDNLSLDSFLLNHSVAYWMAAFISWIEFFLERWMFPFTKEHLSISLIGFMICCLGEFARKAAMVTANTNFNHVVQVKKLEQHKLVTWGVYKYVRHPSYVGWFWWSLGTQVILLNPICFVGYAITSWYFFYVRIYHEEMLLINFFGQKYIKYKKKVGTGLPFISGYNFKPIDNPK